MRLPEDIYNRGLDQLGQPPIGSFEDGTPASEAGRRHYTPTLRGLLRAAHWSFARKQAPLQCLGDAQGQTAMASTIVEMPWRYAYAWPVDGVAMRWVPWRMTPPPGAIPLMPNLAAAPPFWTGSRPARFLVSSSSQYPIAAGEIDWPDLPDLDETEGVGLTARRIILTDVPQAEAVYTKFADEIEEWDGLFEDAMALALAARAALAVVPDKKEALALRAAAIASAREALTQARIASANDAGFPQTISHVPDWIRARNMTRRGNEWLPGAGYLFMGWQPFAMADGSVF